MSAIVGVAAAAASTARHAVRPRAGRVTAKVRIPAGTGGFAVGQGAVWAVSDPVPTLTRIDPRRNAVAASIKIKLVKACPAQPPGCGDAAAGDGAVWVTHLTDNTVSRIDPPRNRVVRTIKVGSRPVAVAVTPGAYGSRIAAVQAFHASTPRRARSSLRFGSLHTPSPPIE